MLSVSIENMYTFWVDSMRIFRAGSTINHKSMPSIDFSESNDYVIRNTCIGERNPEVEVRTEGQCDFLTEGALTGIQDFIYCLKA